MEYVSVKLPKDKAKYVRLLKAEKIRSGDLDVTDAEVLGEALEFSFKHENEFINRRKGVSIDVLLKYAGAWKNVSGGEIRKLKKEIREWRKIKREFAW